MNEYSKFLVKQYQYWGVYVHENQSYLGRCIVWCDREDALHLTELHDDEQKELFIVLRELQKASEIAFGGNAFNFAFLGNETHHVHCHFIPRYSAEKIFEGIKFTDTLWGHNYKTDTSFVTSPEILEKIRLQLQKCLA